MAEAVAWVGSRAELAADGHEYPFAIVGEGGRFLGGCGINQINRIHGLGNLGYWVRSSATGRGVASEAVRQAAAFAFENTELVRLEIVCAVRNERSQRVAERAGGIEAPVAHVDGRATHALLDTGLVHVLPAQPDQDQVPLRGYVLHEADHLGVETGDLISPEHGAPLSFHPHFDLAERQDVVGPARGNTQSAERRDHDCQPQDHFGEQRSLPCPSNPGRTEGQWDVWLIPVGEAHPS
jgi:hypothetical protein